MNRRREEGIFYSAIVFGPGSDEIYTGLVLTPAGFHPTV